MNCSSPSWQLKHMTCHGQEAHCKEMYSRVKWLWAQLLRCSWRMLKKGMQMCDSSCRDVNKLLWNPACWAVSTWFCLTMISELCPKLCYQIWVSSCGLKFSQKAISSTYNSCASVASERHLMWRFGSCHGLDKNGLHRLIHLNSWPPRIRTM